MPRFAYVGPLDGIDIPLLRLTEVRPGDEFDVTDEQAALLAVQPDNYAPVDEAAQAIAAVAIAEAEAAFAALVPAPADLDTADEAPALGVIGEPGPELATTDPAPAGDDAQEG